MINEKNLNNMYDFIINNSELTTKDLKNCGFTSNDLTKLIEENTLERIKRGYYSLKDINSLIFYGKKLVGQKEYEKATACFWKCYELQPTNYSVCFQLFLREIQNENYEEAFKFFEKFYTNNNIFYKIDNTLYLFLLNYITDIPNKYKEIAKNINFNDIEINRNDKRYDNKDKQNEIRKNILNYKFSFAIKQISNEENETGKLTFQNLVTRTLLYKALNKKNEIKENITVFLNKKDYAGIIEYLEQLEKRINFNQEYKYLLKISKDLYELSSASKMPHVKIKYANNMFEAIEGNNYLLALTICSEYIKKYNIDEKSNLIYLLLLEYNNIYKNLLEKKQKQNNFFVDIFNYLMNNDLENTFITLKNYLRSINKSEYEFVIVNLIKISILENDLTYTKPMLELSNMKRQKYKLYISKYIENYYKSLAQNKNKEAELYLDIINKFNNLKKANIPMDKLNQITNESQNNLPKKEEKQSEIIPIIEENKKIRNFDVENFINIRKEKLIKDGIIILKPLDEFKKKEIQNYLKENNEIDCFNIVDDGETRIVLRYKDPEQKHINLTECFEDAKKAYNKERYKYALKKFKSLLKVGNPNYFVYLYLGLIYMKKHETKLSLQYLIVANDLAKKNNSKYDYTRTIELLKGNVNPDYKKPNLKPMRDDYYNDLNDNYGIENIDEIANLMQSGVDFKDIINKFELNNDQMCLVALIFAKNLYANKNFTLGDKYLKLAEKGANKNKYINSLIYKIRANKRFYQNKVNETYKPLVLLPQKIY